MGLQTGTRYTIGYTESRGRGRLSLIGLTPSPELLLALYDHLGFNIPSRSFTPQISTAFFRRDQEFYLLAVNDGNEDKTAEVVLTEDFPNVPCWRARNLVSNHEWTINLRESSHLTFPVPRKDGVILQLQGV